MQRKKLTEKRFQRSELPRHSSFTNVTSNFTHQSTLYNVYILCGYRILRDFIYNYFINLYILTIKRFFSNQTLLNE